MEIVKFDILNDFQRTQAAQMLTDEIPEGWATLPLAEKEILECEENSEHILFAAVQGDEVVGWTGLESQWGKVFELHPLVVRGDMQGKGIGTKLLEFIENTAKEKGGTVLILGASDENDGGETSLANTDLYENLYEKLSNFTPGTHQTVFYLKRGYTVTGVIPDAYGINVTEYMF